MSDTLQYVVLNTEGTIVYGPSSLDGVVAAARNIAYASQSAVGVYKLLQTHYVPAPVLPPAVEVQ